MGRSVGERLASKGINAGVPTPETLWYLGEDLTPWSDLEGIKSDSSGMFLTSSSNDGADIGEDDWEEAAVLDRLLPALLRDLCLRAEVEKANEPPMSSSGIS